jgi:hypothetical protein
MSQYQGDVESILSQIGQANPPSGFNAFPDFTKAITDLQNGTTGAQTDSASLKQAASDAIAKAKSALKAFDQIAEDKLIQDKGFSRDFVLYIINSKGNFVRAMELYREAGELLTLAAEADGTQRDQLVARAAAITASPTRSSGARTPITSRPRPRRARSRRRRRFPGFRPPPAPRDRRPPPDPRVALGRAHVGRAARGGRRRPGRGPAPARVRRHRTRREVLTMRAAADRLLAELDAAGMERAVVCGLSLGGYVAFEVWRIARDRVAGLVLANTRAVADAPEAPRDAERSRHGCVRRATSWRTSPHRSWPRTRPRT